MSRRLVFEGLQENGRVALLGLWQHELPHVRRLSERDGETQNAPEVFATAGLAACAPLLSPYYSTTVKPRAALAKMGATYVPLSLSLPPSLLKVISLQRG